jgi:hypothetical protein
MADEKMEQPLHGFWSHDRGLSFFLGFLVVMTIFVPMFRQSRPERVVLDLTFALMFVSGAIATISQPIVMYLIFGLTILEFTADLIVEFRPALIQWDWDGHTRSHDAQADFSSRSGQRAPGYGRHRRLSADWPNLGVGLQAATGEDSCGNSLPIDDRGKSHR